MKRETFFSFKYSKDVDGSIKWDAGNLSDPIFEPVVKRFRIGEWDVSYPAYVYLQRQQMEHRGSNEYAFSEFAGDRIEWKMTEGKRGVVTVGGCLIEYGVN